MNISAYVVTMAIVVYAAMIIYNSIAYRYGFYTAVKSASKAMLFILLTLFAIVLTAICIGRGWSLYVNS